MFRSIPFKFLSIQKVNQIPIPEQFVFGTFYTWHFTCDVKNVFLEHFTWHFSCENVFFLLHSLLITLTLCDSVWVWHQVAPFSLWGRCEGTGHEIIGNWIHPKWRLVHIGLGHRCLSCEIAKTLVNRYTGQSFTCDLRPELSAVRCRSRRQWWRQSLKWRSTPVGMDVAVH